MQDIIVDSYRECRERILEIRRHLHQYPELGDQELETTEYLEKILQELGCRTERPLPTGLTAVLEPEQSRTEERSGQAFSSGLCVGVRADIDALPVKELCDLPFRSRNEGIMHACGHDMHMAAVLGAAMILSCPEVRSRLSAPVKFLFQPAEETDGGAARMIETGCLRNPDVAAMLGLHCEPELPAGDIAVGSGFVRASSDMFDIIVHGKSSHGASPENGVDAIVAASQIVLSLQALITRNISAYEPCVITIGKFHAGAADNVVCEEAVLTGTMRTASPEVRDLALRRMREIAEHTAAAFGASAELRIRSGYIALYNDSKAAGLLQNCAEEFIGAERVHTLDRPLMSVDDFSFFAREVPSVYFFAGTGFAGRENAGLHHGAFEADEGALDTIVPLLSEAILRTGEEFCRKES